MASNFIVKNIKTKIQSKGLLLALAAISITGFILGTITLATGKVFANSYWWIAIILGAGLILESQIIKILTNNKPDRNAITKVIIGALGILIIIGGVLSIPALSITIGPRLQTILIGANIVAILAILTEVFLIQ